MRRVTGLLGLLLAVACLAPASALAADAHEYERSFGPDGTTATHFVWPGPMAVDQETHDLYVTDLEAGTLYKFDENGVPANFSALPSNQITGFAFSAGEGLNQIAVDSTSDSVRVPSHNLYVADYLSFSSVKAFKPDGTPADFTAGPGAGTNELPTSEPCGVAVDQNGAIYVADYSAGVHVYAPDGAELTSFTAPESCNLAVDSQGAVYVAAWPFGGVPLTKFAPSEFPVTATTTYGPDSSIGESSPGAGDGDGVITSTGTNAIAVDPATNDLYAAERIQNEPYESQIAQYDEEGNLISTFAGPGAPGELEQSEGVAVDASTGNVFASDDRGEKQVEIFAPPPPEPPKVKSITATNVTSASASLRAQINPELFATHYHFEYVTEAQFEASGFAGATKTAETNLGSSGEAQPAQAFAGGLNPDTTYRFRIVAENAGGTTTSAEPAPRFTTFPTFPPGLPDGRAYEMVSPSLKVGEVFAPEPSGDFAGSCGQCLPGINNQMMPMQSADDGEAVVYEGQPFSAGLASGPNEYLSHRASSGWGTQALSSPVFASGDSSGEGYKAFSSDLSRGVLFQIDPVLSPEAPSREGEGFANLYLRDAGGSLQPLIVDEPPNRDPGFGAAASNEFRVVYAGANAGTPSIPAFSHQIFAANDALTGPTADAPAAVDGGVASKEGFPTNLNLYEWVDGGLRLVNVAPGNATTAPGAVIGSGRLLAQSTLEGPNVDHAISDDGSRIFWSEESSGQVYVRIDGEETEEIEDPGKFLTASADGSKVLLNDGCLYDLGTKACEDLTGGQLGFQGILGAAEDLSRVYFVDTKVLTGGEENDNEEHAEDGKFNLYAWEEGDTAFVGILLGADNSVGLRYGAWEPSPQVRTAQVNPDGRYLAFMSRAALSGYDNDRSGGGGCAGISACREVFEYDAGLGKLTCVSCNPTGLRPLHQSTLSVIKGNPGFPPLPQPSNLTPGGRIFFESQDVLSPRDTNGTIMDVYEWEPNGVGSCKRAGGCIFLISSGHSVNDSFFIDATPSGDDAFIVTRERLSLTDRDDQLDLYDARVGGGIAAETETVRGECQGEACQPAANVPTDPTPSSSSFHGAGNEKPKAKHHKKKKRKRHAKKGHHKRAANTNRGGVK